MGVAVASHCSSPAPATSFLTEIHFPSHVSCPWNWNYFLPSFTHSTEMSMLALLGSLFSQNKCQSPISITNNRNFFFWLSGTFFMSQGNTL